MARAKASLKEQVESGTISSQQAVVMALNHPLRVTLLTILTERPASPSDLEAAGVESLSNIAYHCRVLHELGQIEIVDEKPVRGALEHFYRAINRPFFHDPDWEKFSPAVRRAISSYGVDTIFKDVNTALTAGTFDARSDRHLSRNPMLLDQEGWVKANKIQNDALDQILEVQAEAAGRMTASGEESIPVVAAMACFEMPDPGGQTDDD